MNADEKKRAQVARDHYDADAAPVIEELRAVGFSVESVGDLYNKKLNYQRAIPILVKWLSEISNVVVKEDIVRALSVKWAKNTAAAALLLVEFKHAKDSTDSGLRWAIGNALEVLVTDEIKAEMIELAKDSRFGRSREMVVLGLGKLKDPSVVSVLIELLKDDQVIAHAVMALRKLKAKEARTHIEHLLDHPRSLVRREAKNALKWIV